MSGNPNVESWVLRMGLRLHQMIVHKLVRIGSQAELAAERPVEGEDDKDNEAKSPLAAAG
jgi:hypothetical protein